MLPPVLGATLCPTLVWDCAGQPGPGPSLGPFEQSNTKIFELNFTIIYSDLVKHPPVPVNPLSSVVVMNIPFGDGKFTTFKSIQKWISSFGSSLIFSCLLERWQSTFVMGEFSAKSRILRQQLTTQLLHICEESSLSPWSSLWSWHLALWQQSSDFENWIIFLFAKQVWQQKLSIMLK